jgi:hypothetical protein
MGRSVRLGLVLLLALCFVMIAGAMPAFAAGADVQFLGARFIVGKGLLVMLKVAEGSEAQSASVTVAGVQYELDCRAGEPTQGSVVLRCIAAVPPSSVGDEAIIRFGSASFTTTLKDPRPWCYTVFDFGPDGWGPIGAYCKAHTAGVGDFIKFFNPDYPAVPFWDYRYDLDSSRACNGHSPNFGDGYYFYC